jgi:hypothetical protein
MDAERARRFILYDAIVLVAATGIGLWLIRHWAPATFAFSNWPPLSDRIGVTIAVTSWAFGTWPLAISWTIAVAVLAFRQPRPVVQELARQPGVLACLTACLMFALAGIPNLFVALIVGFRALPEDVLAGLSDKVGYAVATAWLLAFWGGSRRAVPTWIDRLGIFIGIWWVVISVSASVWDMVVPLSLR